MAEKASLNNLRNKPHRFLKPPTNSADSTTIQACTSADSVTTYRLTSSVMQAELHVVILLLFYYYLFVTCNWVVTRWQESVTLIHVIQFHGLPTVPLFTSGWGYIGSM